MTIHPASSPAPIPDAPTAGARRCQMTEDRALYLVMAIWGACVFAIGVFVGYWLGSL